jgi:hypothetical protein
LTLIGAAPSMAWGVVEVLQQRQAKLHRPLQPGPLERLQVLHT